MGPLDRLLSKFLSSSLIMVYQKAYFILLQSLPLYCYIIINHECTLHDDVMRLSDVRLCIQFKVHISEHGMPDI
jgi:hypothetical protein